MKDNWPFSDDSNDRKPGCFDEAVWLTLIVLFVLQAITYIFLGF